MGDEIEELKNLSPEERIKRLKELEEKRKKEIEEAHKLIRQSEAELEEEQKEKEQIPIPQLKAETDETLFGEPEKEMFRAKRFVSERAKEVEESLEQKPLEQTVFEEAPTLTAEEHSRHEQNQAYIMQLSQRPANELTQEIYKLAQGMEEGGANEYKIQRMYTLQKAIGQKRSDLESGQYNPGDKTIAEEVDIGYRITQAFLDDYRRDSMDKYRRAG